MIDFREENSGIRFEITFWQLWIFITVVWLLVRTFFAIKNKKIDIKHEVKLLTVYVCLVVVSRFVYFPLGLENGHIKPLVFDSEKITPIWYNLVPIKHMFDHYDGWLVNIIGNIVGPQDLILHDSLAHNSSVQGCILSHAKRMHFRHNDMEHLERTLKKFREKFRRVLIIAEGIYSMDGDICDLPELIRLKKEYGAMLMIDEAHSFGTIGDCGRGITSYYEADTADVDILMGTLSKSAASCGGYIAGSSRFIKYLRYNSPGFVFSCGMTPANTAAACRAIELFEEESFRIEKLHSNSQYFLNKLSLMGYDTGLSEGTPIIPIILGDSHRAIDMSNDLFREGINALPIVYPAVKENEARIRFFISASHTREDLDRTLDVLLSLR